MSADAGQGDEFRALLEELTGDNESAGFLEIGSVDEQSILAGQKRLAQYAERQAHYMAGTETGAEVHSTVTNAGALRVTVTPTFDGGVHVAITDERGWLLGVLAHADGAKSLHRPGYGLEEVHVEREDGALLAGFNSTLAY